MPSKKIKDFLDENHVKYTTLVHSMAYTAQEIAAMAHIPGRELAKTVIVQVDGRMAMAVLPSLHHVDLERLRNVTSARNVRLATEAEFKGLFPECEAGAMPPFGNLYGLETYVDPELAYDDEISFNAGTHIELIRMNFQDFKRLVRPRICEFAL
jgi:Ala-tRNA(Pro) deacylase